MSEFPAAGPAGTPGAQDRRPGAGQPEQEVPASVRGAVDLGAVGARDAGAGQQDGASYRVSITTETFQGYAEESARVPVVVVLHAPQSPESEDFVETLASVVDGYAGKLLLATVDVSREPQIAQAFQAQQVPMTLGLIAGQPVPLFPGVQPPEQLRPVVDEILKVAEQNGVTGRIDLAGGDAPEAEPVDPRYEAAFDAIERGDYDAAIAAYEQVLKESPADAEAKVGLAQVRLMRRTEGVDLQAARDAAAQSPDDVDAQIRVADLDLVGGHVEDAFARLVDVVRRTSEDERERARTHLLELFEVVGAHDDRVAKARRALMSALF